MRSDNVTKGVQQAPHRSLFNALGYDKGRNGQADDRYCKLLQRNRVRVI